MKLKSLAERLAVCSWSLQPASPQELIAQLGGAGLRRVQLALDPLRKSPAVWGDLGPLFADRELTIISGMARCVGEDYSTIDSIRRTGGIVRDETWAENLANFHAVALLAERLGLRLVTFHAGFVPHDEADPALEKMVGRLQELAEIFAARQMVLGLETGQETAPDLARLLRRLDRPNLRVNFDPANMLLYDKGDPVEAVRLLAPWICQVHIKDARRPLVPGAWGEEVPVGSGEVDWAGFFAALARSEISCDLVIEREAGGQRVADIRTAREFIEQLH